MNNKKFRDNPNKNETVHNTAVKRYDSATKSNVRSSEENEKENNEQKKSIESKKNLLGREGSCDSFVTSNNEKSQTLEKFRRGSVSNQKTLLKTKKNILNDLPFN